ncbi:Polyphenol oxidase 1 [Cytospora mali]|uniref:Polyphenol oxidase 1 n=1 Tax=Cytospora mali TaxID=578113 RepID=A0A194VQC6_CYTMA|nr:Polyphenol oxidase 1 [Valsa mali]
MSPRVPQLHILCNLSLLLLLCCMVSLVLGQSYDYGFDVAKAFKAKRQLEGDIIITTGVPVTGGIVPTRPEIRDLQQDPDKWSLYVLALDMMQYTYQPDPTSWFSITGIHGVPFQPWNSVQPTPGNEQAGYCQHQNILFPTWHRAYVALYEQELCKRVGYIATLYNGDVKNRFEAAASDCRAPYFDWAALPPSSADSMLPASIGDSPQITVSGPKGTQPIANPLFAYEFAPPNPDVFQNVAPWANWSVTRRAPTSLNASASSNNSAINTYLVNHTAQNQQRLYNLFSNYDNYTMFSNEGWAADTSKYDSLEALHDNVHAMLGGIDGHMTIVPFSAFDPLFFLHHCMVDRVFALWQVLHPDAWVTPDFTRLNSYTTTVGQLLDSSSALTPFYVSSNGTFWNSDMLRDPTSLGYTYAELSSAGIRISNRSSVFNGQSEVAAVINQLYGRFSVNSLSLQSSKRSEHSRYHHKHGSTRSLPVNKIISSQGQYREWIANIRVMRQALDGPFTVRLSLGQASSHVGSMGVFASPPEIASMRQMAPGAEYITSTIPLTATLVDKVTDGTLTSMDPGVVGPYLQKYLATSVVGRNTSEVDPSNVAGLSIKVVSWPVQATTSEKHLPVWDEADYELDIM